jgi:hypothetical protein
MGRGAEAAVTLLQSAPEFTPTISLGVLILGAAIIIATAILTARVNSGKAWRDEAEALRAAVARLQAVADERTGTIKTLEEQLVKAQDALAVVGGKNVYEQILLESNRAAERYEQALTAINQSFQELHWRVEKHEQRADERHAKLLVVLDLMAARYGPEPDLETAADQ